MHLQTIPATHSTSRPAPPEALFAPPYVLHPASHEVQVNGDVLRLTTKEFDLAYFLFRRRGEPVSRRELGERVWGHGPAIESRTLDAHVSRLRRKLSIYPANGWRLVALYGFGYSLQPSRVA